jgi:hypothetical protein
LGFFLKLGVFSFKSLNAASRVYQFLFAGKKRMALGADFNANILFGGTYLDDVTAGTGNGRFKIVRVNFGFHLSSDKIVNLAFSQSYNSI